MWKKTITALVAATLIVLTTAAAIRFQNAHRAFEAPLTEDEFGRLYTAVFVNGEGPISFLVDTGAAMSCVSPALADRLKLSRIPGMKVNVQGTSGTETGTMYLATSYKSDVFNRKLEPLVGLLNAGAVKDGVVGMNAFSSRRLGFDIRNHRLAVGPSGPSPAAFNVLQAQIRGTEIIVDVEVDGTPAKAIVDTGARRTIGNSALRERLGLKSDDPRLTPAEPSQGATNQHLPALRVQLRSIKLGEARFDAPQITFSELDLFGRRGLGNVPALLLGMDLLGSLQAVAVDYPRSELQVKP